MDEEQELTTQSTPTAPTPQTQQASQIQAELNQRMNNAIKRRTETSVNHRGEMFKQNKPTITEQIHHINPPRIFSPIKPETLPVPMSDDDELMTGQQHHLAPNQDHHPRLHYQDQQQPSIFSLEHPMKPKHLRGTIQKQQ